MSGKGGKYVTSSGTNSQGNTYTNYSDGGYRLASTGSILSFNPGTPTLLVPNSTTLGRDTLSSRGAVQFSFLTIFMAFLLAVAPRALRGLEECPTPPTPTRTRATPPPSTSNSYARRCYEAWTVVFFVDRLYGFHLVFVTISVSLIH